MKEIWKRIDGFEDYEISDFGRVRSSKRKIPIFLKPYTNKSGYKHIMLYRRGKSFAGYIHKLVATTFIGPPPPNKCISHINEDSTDNRLYNLCYETISENTMRPLHRQRQGYSQPLSKHGFRGIYQRPNGKYSVQVVGNKQHIYCGYFLTAKEAAENYDKVATKLYGDHAITNKKLGLL